MSQVQSAARQAALLVMAAVLAGCSLLYDPLRELEQSVQGRLETVTAQVPGGRLIFYRAVEEHACASGVIWYVEGARGRTGGGGRPCDAFRAMTFTAFREPDGPFALLFGEVNDDRIARVTAALDGEEEPREAVLLQGHWYLYLPDSEILPDVGTIVGLDREGTEVFRIP